jgi:hypothetical protein
MYRKVILFYWVGVLFWLVLVDFLPFLWLLWWVVGVAVVGAVAVARYV